MDGIEQLIRRYNDLNRKLEEHNRLFSKDSFKLWIEKKSNEDKKMRYLNKASELIDGLKKLGGIIKAKIDNYYMKEKINFIEIEKEFRDRDIPAYLIAIYKDEYTKGIKTVNSDNEPVDYVTHLLITDDDEILKETIGSTDDADFKKKVELNLNLLIKAGVTIVENEDDTRNSILEEIEAVSSADNLNDY